MFDFLQRIGRALLGLWRRKPAEKRIPLQIPLFVVLRMGDHLVMVLARHRGQGVEKWTWIWPLAQIERLELQLLQEGARPGYFADLRDIDRAWEYAKEAAEEWREGIRKES